jgi:hypothetical protein
LNIEDAVSYGERGDGTERDVDDGQQDEADPLGLSEEQADTNQLLRQLLGTAIADRHVDFCRLSSGRLPLIVSRPHSQAMHCAS